MADLIFVETTDYFVKLQLSVYVNHSEWFPDGVPVLEQRTGGTATTLASDGSGANVLNMNNATLNALIANSKPAGYVTATKKMPGDCPLYQYTHIKWSSIINATREARNKTQAAGTNPLDPT